MSNTLYLREEVEKLKERVDKIYNFCQQVQEYIASLESSNY